MIEQATLHALDNISWSFSGSVAPGRSKNGLFDARSIHWYPATFIPEIPYSLIEILTKPGDKVLDPFAGIGTTLWQARALGREAFGSELTLVGHNIAEDIWHLLSDDSLLGDAQDQVLSILRNFRSVDLTDSFLSTTRGALLAPWFSPGTLKELAFIASAEEMVAGSTAFRLLRLSTSGILASVSEQRRGWGCIADNMQPKPSELLEAPGSRNAVDKVAVRAKAIVRAVAETRNRLGTSDLPFLAGDAASHIFPGDSVRSGALAQEAFYDLVVTSPPYPAMVDYSTAQRLSYYWHGVLPERDVPKEIGARRRRFSSKWLSDYTSEMQTTLSAVGKSLKVGGRLALVVPVFSSSLSDDPRTVAIDHALESVAPHFELRWVKERILPANRRQLNSKWTSLRREQIRIYERTE